MINEIVSAKSNELVSLCIRYKVKQLYLFGSAVSDKFNINSDLDFLVEFFGMNILDYGDNFFDFKDQLTTLFNRRIDLITSCSLENPYLIASINQSKETIYAA